MSCFSEGFPLGGLCTVGLHVHVHSPFTTQLLWIETVMTIKLVYRWFTDSYLHHIVMCLKFFNFMCRFILYRPHVLCTFAIGHYNCCTEYGAVLELSLSLFCCCCDGYCSYYYCLLPLGWQPRLEATMQSKLKTSWNDYRGSTKLCATGSLQCDWQVLKQKQTFPHIASGWTDSATQIQKHVQLWLAEREPKDYSGSERIYLLCGYDDDDDFIIIMIMIIIINARFFR